MFTMYRPVLILLILSCSLFAGEVRIWTSPDGTKTFKAALVSRQNNSITLLREDEKVLSFEISKLHEDDQRWLNLNFPLGKDGHGEAMPEASAVFDTLKFGDSRETVLKKLQASKIVETSVDGMFFGRTGLNGTFRTRHKIGGLFCYLFFDWNASGALKELTLQTESKPAELYDATLAPCWTECIDLITTIHGNPVQRGKIPTPHVLEDGQMLASHLWRLDHGGTVMLGIARQGNGYEVAVRFTREKIEANPIP
jgi:hypothetical protein